MNIPETTKALKLAELNPQEVSKLVDKFIKNIEFFQLSSKMNDMFSTFMPVLWDDIKDGEFMFRKYKKQGGNAYACDINLDMETLGKMSVSVSIYKKAYYVTFLSEREDVVTLLNANKKLLTERFSAQGLNLSAINIAQKKDIYPGKAQTTGINVKI